MRSNSTNAMKRLILISLIYLTIAAASRAEETNSPTRKENLAQVNETLQNNLKQYKNNNDFFVRRGVLADRKKQMVTILAEANDISAKSIVEFFVIDETSGHAYESLTSAFARPSDVLAALEFIGMSPGRPIDISKHAFWPKGERVIMRIDGKRAENYVYDDASDEPTAERGFVFTGGIMIPDSKDPAKQVCAADVREPGSMCSNYNENESLLDIPRRAPQKTVYGHNLMTPELVLPAGKFVTITMEPEYKTGKKRVMDLTVVLQDGGGPGNEIANVHCKVGDKNFSVAELIVYFRNLLEEGHDPFVTLRFEDGLRLKDITAFCTSIAPLDTDNGIRMEPPAEGCLYYQAYNPPAQFLNRTGRSYQPLELFLEKKDAVISGTIKQFIATWPEGSMTPDLEEKAFPIKSSAELRKTLDTIESAIPVVLVHAPANLTHGELMAFAGTALSSHPLMHVFTAD